MRELDAMIEHVLLEREQAVAKMAYVRGRSEAVAELEADGTLEAARRYRQHRSDLSPSPLVN